MPGKKRVRGESHPTARPAGRRLGAVAAAAAIASAFAAGAASAATTTIAMSDQAAPEGNGQFVVFSEPFLTASGEVAFLALLKNTAGAADDDQGLYFHNGTSLVNRVRENTALPEGNGLFGDVQIFVINNAGQMAFASDLRNTSGGTNDNSGVYLYNGTQVVNRAREGAGTPDGNGVFDSFQLPMLAPTGEVAFYADLRGTAGGTNDNSGIFVHNGTILTKRVRENETIAGGGGQYASFGLPFTFDAGQSVVFKATIRNNPGGALDDSGIFAHRLFDSFAIARENALVPEGNGRFDLFAFFPGSLTTNSLGQVAFQAELRNTALPGLDDSGIYLWDFGVLQNRARENALVPEGNGRFTRFFAPQLNAGGQVAFAADLKQTAAGGNDDSGIYLHNGTSLLNIARENVAPPDGNGQFSGFGEPTLSNTGQVVFEAGIRNAAGGADGGIYIGDGVELVRVVRDGETLAGKTVDSANIVRSASPENGESTSINEYGQVAFRAQFLETQIYQGGELPSIGNFLWTPDLRWRSAGGGNWDTTTNWTLGLRPAGVHAVAIDPAANLTVMGPTSAASVKSLQIGGNNASGVATLSLQPNGPITSATPVVVAATGVLTGNGTVNGAVTNNGTILADNLTIAGPLTNNGMIAGTGSITSPLPIVIGLNGVLTGSATINANVTNNGSVIADSLTINGTLTNHATISGSGRINGTIVNATSGVMSGALTLGGNVTNNGTVLADELTIAGSLGNNGIIEGLGRVSGAVTNNASGQIRVTTGADARFLGSAAHTNAGRIEVLESSLEFGGALDNSGTIAGREMLLHFGGAGLSNSGNVQVSFGVSDVFGNVTNNSGGKVTLSGSSNVTFYSNVTNNAGGIFQTSTGSSAVFFGFVTNTGTFAGGGTKYFEGGSSGVLGAFASDGATVVADGAAVTAQHLREHSLTVEGQAQVLANGTSSGTSRTTLLSVGGQLDVTNNKLIVAAGELGSWNGSGYTSVSGLVASGRHAGAWDGNGIITSMPDALIGLTGLGVVTAAQAGHAGGTFGGLSVSANDVLVMYTYAGDANFDGKINIDDYGRIDGNVASSGSVFGWFNGDFNYDGKINIDDYGIIDGNINRQGAAFLTSGASLESATADLGELSRAVPEPSMTALLLASLTCLTRRARRVL